MISEIDIPIGSYSSKPNGNFNFLILKQNVTFDEYVVFSHSCSDVLDSRMA